jgi:hypothetical protein
MLVLRSVVGRNLALYPLPMLLFSKDERAISVTWIRLQEPLKFFVGISTILEMSG